MSEEEKIDLYKRLGDAIRRSTKAMLERKAKLGESVVITNSEGNPINVSATEALQIFNKTAQ